MKKNMKKIKQKIKFSVLINEPMSVVTHFIGLLASIVGLIFMVIYANTYGSVKHIVGFSIFGIRKNIKN